MLIQEMMKISGSFSDELEEFADEHFIEVDEFLKGNLEGLQFTSLEMNGDEALYDHSPNWDDVWFDMKNHLEPEVIREIVEQSIDFLKQAWEYIPQSKMKEAGGDFHLTRNRHGAGFWDGDWEHGNKLTELCQGYGSQSLYGQLDENKEIIELEIFN